MRIENSLMLLPGRKIGRGSITVDGGKIVAIDCVACTGGALGDRALPGDVGRGGVACTACPRYHTDKLILPGLINCHGHTAMTLVRGLGGGLPLQRWLEEAIFPVEAKMTGEDIYAGAKWGAMEMLAGGTTAVADMYDFPADGERAFEECGITAFTNRVGLSFIPGRLEEAVEFTRGKASRHLCIHSEYLTDEKFCRGMAEANKELKRPLHLHVSETKKEHAECIARHGKTPIAYLADTGILDYGGYAAHCVYCTDDDFRIMAEKGIALVHNPTSNMKLGSGFARILRAKELGVNVALGTDGCASNDNLDMFEEMHIASLIHKGLACDPTALSAWDVIEMATINGAKALGMKDAGELKVGNRADFCVVELNKPHLLPCLDVANLIVNSMHASDVVETYVGGEKVYDRGAFTRIDAEAAQRDFIAAVKRLFV